MPTISPTTPYDDLKEWLTPHEVAAYMQVSAWTVYQAIHSGDIPHRRFGPKKIYIPKSHFHASVARCADASTADPTSASATTAPRTRAKRGNAVAVAEALP